MNIKMGPTGRTIVGSIMDCSVAPLQRQLREYDAQLYIKWNPEKLGGVGCWEVRRKPEMMTVRPSYESARPGIRPHRQGDIYQMDIWTAIVWPKYHETDQANHVLDCRIMDYRILPRIKKMDLWEGSYKGKNYVNDLEYEEAKFLEKEEAKANDVREYMIKQNRRQINEFKEYVLSGGDPNRLAEYWGKE